MAQSAALDMMTGAEAHRSDTDRRRRPRHAIVLLARYVLSDGREYPCQTKDLSACGAALYAPVRGRMDEETVLHLPGLDRVLGRIVRPFPGGFAMTWRLAPERRETLERRLELAAAQPRGAEISARRDACDAPKNALLRLATGEEIVADILSIGLTGATLRTQSPLAVGMRLMMCKTAARVIRSRDCVSSVEFLTPVRRLWPTGRIEF